MTLTGSSSTTKSNATSAADAALTDLLKSATFAMSLGAKELFHTNFLAFILESQDPALAGLQDELRRLLNCQWVHGDEHFCLVWREKNDLDLIIMLLKKLLPSTAASSSGQNGAGAVDESDVSAQAAQAISLGATAYGYLALPNRAVVVEAKLKSIPTPGQLKKYSGYLAVGITLDLPEDIFPLTNKGKLQTTKIPASPGSLGTRVLLSARNSSSGGWTYVGWDAIVSIFKNQLPLNPAGNLSVIITDYKVALNNLLEILKWVDAEFAAFSGSPAAPGTTYKFSVLVKLMK